MQLAIGSVHRESATRLVVLAVGGHQPIAIEARIVGALKLQLAAPVHPAAHVPPQICLEAAASLAASSEDCESARARGYDGGDGCADARRGLCERRLLLCREARALHRCDGEEVERLQRSSAFNDAPAEDAARGPGDIFQVGNARHILLGARKSRAKRQRQQVPRKLEGRLADRRR